MPLASLPPPDVYEREYQYWPWGRLIKWAVDWICRNAPANGALVDYMCGTGYLLAEVARQRSDLRLFGCDIHAPFVEYSKRKYGGIMIECADALEYRPPRHADIVICTAGLHHLPPHEQSPFFEKVERELDSGDAFLVGEEVLPTYHDLAGRARAALNLGTELIAYGLAHDWPADMLAAAIDVLKNDVLEEGEYKRSLEGWMEMLSRRFQIGHMEKFWFVESCGDVALICRKKTRR